MRANVVIFYDIWKFASIFWKVCWQNFAKFQKCTTSANFGTCGALLSWFMWLVWLLCGKYCESAVIWSCGRALWKAPGERPMGRDCVDTRFSMAWNKKEVNCCILWFPVIYLTCKYNVGGGYRTPKKPSVGEAKTSRRVSVKYKLSRISFEKQKEVFLVEEEKMVNDSVDGCNGFYAHSDSCICSRRRCNSFNMRRIISSLWKRRHHYLGQWHYL